MLKENSESKITTPVDIADAENVDNRKHIHMYSEMCSANITSPLQLPENLVYPPFLSISFFFLFSLCFIFLKRGYYR